MERMGGRPLQFLSSGPIPCGRVENERDRSHLYRNVPLTLDFMRLFNFRFLRVRDVEVVLECYGHTRQASQ